MQSKRVEPEWAAENLQVIRTLMERSAIYRRALAPMMLLAGFLGIGAAVLAWFLEIDGPQTFVSYWIGISVVVLCGAFILVRRQALKAAEPFWSLPTRRVTQAALPALSSGLVLTLIITWRWADMEKSIVWWLMPIWMLLHGTALHAAGFFMQRGVKLFGWAFVGLGIIALFTLLVYRTELPIRLAHLFMGLTFGAAHLAYGVYLYFTEQKGGA